MYKKAKNSTLQLKKVGDFLAKFTENSEHVYWISSADLTHIQYVSPSFEKIWGRSREELYQNPENWITFLHPADALTHRPIHKMTEQIALLGDKARYSENYRIIQPNGEVRWIIDKGFPLYDDKGICYGITGIAIDVTEQKKKEEAANQAKEEFIRNMSHDLRTPLSGIIGMSTLIEREATTPEAKERARMVSMSGEQLLTLLNSVLDIVAIDNLKEDEVNLSIFNLSHLLSQLSDLELPTIKLKNLNLHLIIDENIPELIQSDYIKIHRILLNLVGNSVKFTEKGFIEIRVNLKDRTDSTLMLEFSIRDTGLGISIADQKKIFHRFYRVNPSIQGVYAGYGVGLHIVEKYTQLLKGKIHMDSEPGVGTTMSITIPVGIVSTLVEETSHHQLAEPSQHKNPNTSPVHPLSNSMQLATHIKPRVLLIEDNPIALKTAEIILQQANCDHQSAMTGTHALALFKTNLFDLVLSDLGLPDISGVELALLFREIEQKNGGKHVPIIGLTAQTLSETEQTALLAGMDKVLTKPIRFELLQSLLNEYIKTDQICELKNLHSLQYSPTKPLDFHFAQYPLFCLETGISNLGSSKILIDILKLFLAEIPHNLEELKRAHGAKEPDKLYHLAHKIKSGALYCGTIRLQYVCQAIEESSKNKDPVESDQFYEILQLSLTQTMQAVEEWLKPNQRV